MRTDEFDYSLPEDLIAQHPTPARQNSRLLVLHRGSRSLEFSAFERLLHYLRAGDLLVLNNSQVIPARLRGQKAPDGSRLEILLVEPAGPTAWWTLLRPGKRVRPGTCIDFEGPTPRLQALVTEKSAEGHFRLEFPLGTDLLAHALRHGEIPLPPYIKRPEPQPNDRERYQTVYASQPGSVAAPTAGLHFTPNLLGSLRAAGVRTCEVTLHVGPGTFAPVKADRLANHIMHAERFDVSAACAAAVNTARAEGRRVVAVGTTSLRVLESVAREHGGRLVPGAGRTRLFVHPPAEFQLVDALLTNFHLPRSTLLMLVCAFAAPGSVSGRELVLHAYREAITQRFRFFSYGDAMLLV